MKARKTNVMLFKFQRWKLLAGTRPAAKDEGTRLPTEKLKELRGCEMHTTRLPTNGDSQALRKMKINVTSEAIPTMRR